MIMRAIVCENPGRFETTEKPEPTVESGQVLLQIKAIGICGTDLHAFAGNQPYFTYPRILGHELGAEVIGVGEGVHHVFPQDKVVILPYLSCGQCIACRQGKTNCCTQINVLGVHTDGGMQERIVLPANYVRSVQGLDFQELAIIEPLAIGAHAIRRAQIKPGEWVVVVGCGPIGLGIMGQAQHLGCQVIAVDVEEGRLRHAREFMGIQHGVLAEDALEAIQAFTSGDLATAVFDATGHRSALERGIAYMAHGGRYILVGLSKEVLSFSHPVIHAKETSLLCSRNATWDDFEQVIDYLKSGRFPVSGYITNQLPFTEMVDHFADWMDPRAGVIKAMVNL